MLVLDEKGNGYLSLNSSNNIWVKISIAESPDKFSVYQRPTWKSSK